MIFLSTWMDIYAGGQGSGCKGPNCGRTPLRAPTDSEWDHEKMRINNAVKKGKPDDILMRRVNAITKPQKLHNAALALADENFHSLSSYARGKLSGMGYKHGGASAPGYHN